MKVPEGSGAEVRSGSGGFRCTYPGQVPVQRLGQEVIGEVPEGPGANP